MGKTLDALLGRGFKTAKFKRLVNLAISRLAILKNQRQVRCSQARFDVVQLLNLGHHERALLRVELVIKEQNMLDAYVIIESYCHLLIDRVVLIANNEECTDELKEAISSLIFAASRCGEFPDLQELRYLFTLRYGKEFASRAVELRNNCGVNPRIVRKSSTRQPSLEKRMKLLKEIASENRITLKLQEESPVTTEEWKVDVNQKQKQKQKQKQNQPKHKEEVHDLTEEIERDKQFFESIKAWRQYRDVASAVQAAFESAAYAAAAARAAVELSQGKSLDNNTDDPSSPLDKTHLAESSSLDSEGDELAQKLRGIQIKELEERENVAELGRSLPASSSGSNGTNIKDYKMSLNQIPVDDEIKGEEGTIPWTTHQAEQSVEAVLDESDDEAKMEDGTILWSKLSPLGFNGKPRYPRHEFQRTELSTTATDKDLSDLDASINHIPLTSRDYQHKHFDTNKVVMGSRNEDDHMAYPGGGRSFVESKHNLYSKEQVSAPCSNVVKKPVSVRTKRA